MGRPAHLLQQAKQPVSTRIRGRGIRGEDGTVPGGGVGEPGYCVLLDERLEVGGGGLGSLIGWGAFGGGR